MADLLIAIVGSADEGRSDASPKLRNLEAIHEAAGQLGDSLAEAGMRIVVYSSAPTFIEAAVVRGYAANSKARNRSIEVRYPLLNDDGNAPFVEQSTHPELFKECPDENPNWEVSFYTSLREVSGILLIGGARSAFVTGVLAQILRIPLVTVAAFGGSAQAVWALRGNTLATEAERSLMGLPTWQAGSAARLIECFSTQQSRLVALVRKGTAEAESRGRESRNRALSAAVLFVGAVVLTAAGLFVPHAPAAFAAIFFSTPMLAGSAGAVLRTLLAARRGVEYQKSDPILVAAVLGMVAGLASAILFALAQWASNPSIKQVNQGVPEGLPSLLPFMLLIGLVAGLTLELVYRKLESTDVTRLGPIENPAASAGHGGHSA